MAERGDLHRWLQEQLRASVGDRLDRYLADAAVADLDRAMAELVVSLAPATG